MSIRWVELGVVCRLEFALVGLRQEQAALVEPLVSSRSSCLQVAGSCFSCKIGDKRSHSKSKL